MLIHLEDVSEFKYLGCILGESSVYGAECNRKMASGRRVAGSIRSLVNANDLQLECTRFLGWGGPFFSLLPCLSLFSWRCCVPTLQRQEEVFV